MFGFPFSYNNDYYPSSRDYYYRSRRHPSFVRGVDYARAAERKQRESSPRRTREAELRRRRQNEILALLRQQQTERELEREQRDDRRQQNLNASARRSRRSTSDGWQGWRPVETSRREYDDDGEDNFGEGETMLHRTLNRARQNETPTLYEDDEDVRKCESMLKERVADRRRGERRRPGRRGEVEEARRSPKTISKDSSFVVATSRSRRFMVEVEDASDDELEVFEGSNVYPEEGDCWMQPVVARAA